jgi:putative PIN family toxin of toxin-antitoxin system
VRVLLDANVFISYLLYPRVDSPSGAIIRAAIRGAFVLLVPEELLDEFVGKIADKRYLAERIDSEELGEFVALVQEYAEIVPKIKGNIPAVCRDPKDDYLLAHAVLGAADYLVTGDQDLLSLERLEGVKIVTPREFLEAMG